MRTIHHLDGDPLNNDPSNIRIIRDDDNRPLPLYLECPMCGKDEVFVLSKQSGSTGYCFAEKREWSLVEGKNYWPCVACGTEYLSVSNKCSDGCVN